MKASPHAHPMYPPRCSDPPRHTLLPCHESVSLACSERPGPEDWQGPEDSVLFVLSPQTHISLVLFFGLQAPELVSFFFFSPPFLCPTSLHTKQSSLEKDRPLLASPGKTKEADFSWSSILVHIGDMATGELLGPFAGWWLSIFSLGSRDPYLI